MKLIIGHELIADSSYSSTGIWDLPLTSLKQYHAVTSEHVDWFEQALEYDATDTAEGDKSRDATLQQIFSYYGYSVSDYSQWGSGNSMQDLLLSLKGYRFGRGIKDDQDIGGGSLTSLEDAANWLRDKLLND